MTAPEIRLPTQEMADYCTDLLFFGDIEQPAIVMEFLYHHNAINLKSAMQTEEDQAECSDSGRKQK